MRSPQEATTTGPQVATESIESPQPSAERGLLTDDEQTVVRLAGELWGAICTAIPDGPTRDADLHELILHVHAVQHTFMANAAARAYPQTYRLLGSTIPKCLTCESWGRSHCGEHSDRPIASAASSPS